MPLENKARNLYKKTVSEYKDMAVIRDLILAKQLQSVDIGEGTIAKTFTDAIMAG